MSTNTQIQTFCRDIYLDILLYLDENHQVQYSATGSILYKATSSNGLVFYPKTIPLLTDQTILRRVTLRTSNLGSNCTGVTHWQRGPEPLVTPIPGHSNIGDTESLHVVKKTSDKF